MAKEGCDKEEVKKKKKGKMLSRVVQERENSGPGGEKGMLSDEGEQGHLNEKRLFRGGEG